MSDCRGVWTFDSLKCNALPTTLTIVCRWSVTCFRVARNSDEHRVSHWAGYCSLDRGQSADYMTTTTRAAIYARVSTSDQTCENQLLELRRYCQARGWQATEYVDTGISGAKDRRELSARTMCTFLSELSARRRHPHRP